MDGERQEAAATPASAEGGAETGSQTGTNPGSEAAERGAGEHQTADGGLASTETEVALTPEQSFRITLLRNIRYHEDREGFFGLTDRSLNFLVILTGTGVFAAVAHTENGDTAMAKWIALGTTIIGAVQLVFEISRKQFLHEKLRLSFLELLGDLKPENLVETRARAVKLWGEEPPTFYACDALAYNAAMSAAGRPAKYLRRVGPWQRRLRNVIRFTSTDFPEIGEERETDPKAGLWTGPRA